MKKDDVVLGAVLLRPLGAGAAGTVWMAELDGQPCAIKLVSKELAQAAAREVQALGSLQHPLLVSLIKHGVLPNGDHALVLSLAQGKPLTAWANRSPVPTPARIRTVLARLADTLRVVHAAGWVHGDVKASNILVDERDQPTLLDLGIACREGDSWADVVASVHTAAPEQVGQKELTAAVDIYAIGVLLYRLLAGRYPFHSTNPAAVLGAHLHAPIPPLPDDADASLSALCERCLSKDPAQRPTAEQLVTLLGGLPMEPEVESSSVLPLMVVTILASIAAGWVVWFIPT